MKHEKVMLREGDISSGFDHVSYKHVSKVPWRERGTVRTNG